MPKAVKGKNASLLVEAGPVAMDTDATDSLEAGPSGRETTFAPISTFEQNGKKIEFRRVSPVDTSALSSYLYFMERLIPAE